MNVAECQLMKFSLRVAVLLFVGLLWNCHPNHHECDINSYGSHCENGNLVTCEDRSQGEPCGVNEGCDTYVTRTACGLQCITESPSKAMCENNMGVLDGGSDAADSAVDAPKDAFVKGD